ncbi:Eukaryotic aspartyl protease family protein, putative isoform 2 [Hibiscus syriacus]|uniref:Eukaryotic aspartyl protease family protein, putative isoform 2 n=1 Tax=Hibiscus syriacus TaxID=106335 RepID=A0A6A2ZSE5_HIBSY|nr:Eukaryotic aspartyl protease family protein, putative isoform 2 [Hibiscus syriacus]
MLKPIAVLYFTYMLVGNPQRPYFLDIDTGSDLTWIQCMLLAAVVPRCAYDQQGILLNTLSKTDGILGLNRAKVSLPSQLTSKGIINNVVGHCLATDVASSGYMFLGDEFVPNWGMSWVPMLGSPSIKFYCTQLVKINYGSSSLSLGGQDRNIGSVVFDSGSSYTYFTKQAYDELVSSLSEVSELGFLQDASDPTLPICWRAPFPIRSVMDVKKFFKTLTLQFGSKWWIISKKFHIPPQGPSFLSEDLCLTDIQTWYKDMEKSSVGKKTGPNRVRTGDLLICSQMLYH